MGDPDDGAQWTPAGEPIGGREASKPSEGDAEDDPLILWFLSLTPTQRVEVAQDFVDSARMIRDGLRT